MITSPTRRRPDLGLLSVMLFLLFAGGGSHAAIIDKGDYFLDTNTGYHWYSKVHEFINQDWLTAKGNVEALGVGGLGWELASPDDVNTLYYLDPDYTYHAYDDLVEPGHFTITYRDIEVYGWTSEVVGDRALIRYNRHRVQLWYEGSEDTDGTYGWLGAFAVSKGPATVPEPPVLLLLACGIGGLVGLRHRKRIAPRAGRHCRCRVQVDKLQALASRAKSWIPSCSARVPGSIPQVWI